MISSTKPAQWSMSILRRLAWRRAGPPCFQGHKAFRQILLQYLTLIITHPDFGPSKGGVSRPSLEKMFRWKASATSFGECGTHNKLARSLFSKAVKLLERQRQAKHRAQLLIRFTRFALLSWASLNSFSRVLNVEPQRMEKSDSTCQEQDDFLAF